MRLLERDTVHLGRYVLKCESNVLVPSPLKHSEDGVSRYPLWNYTASRTRGRQSEFVKGEICGSKDSDYEGYY